MRREGSGAKFEIKEERERERGRKTQRGERASPN